MSPLPRRAMAIDWRHNGGSAARVIMTARANCCSPPSRVQTSPFMGILTRFTFWKHVCFCCRRTSGVTHARCRRVSASGFKFATAEASSVPTCDHCQLHFFCFFQLHAEVVRRDALSFNLKSTLTGHIIRETYNNKNIQRHMFRSIEYVLLRYTVHNISFFLWGTVATEVTV